MPLRDHFRPPLDTKRSWQGFHGQWPGEIVRAMLPRLPYRYIAEPNVQSDGFTEIDVATFEDEELPESLQHSGNGSGGVATAVWAPSRPTVSIETDLPSLDDYEVRIYDTKRARRLVAAIEIVSPANKDRPEHRSAFFSKCLALLQKLVSVTIIDLVTTREFNLYDELTEQLGHSATTVDGNPSPIYASASRATKKEDKWLIESWYHPLIVGQKLPTLPLWLADNFAIPLELEACYEETCRVLRIP